MSYISPATLFAQSAERLDVNIQTKDDGKWRELTSIIKQGSGEYLILWTCSAKYGIASNPNSKTVRIPLDEEDITYHVFVRDQKTGALGRKSINFSKSIGKISSIAYPNPSRNELTVSLTDNENVVLDKKYHILRAELYSEKSGGLVKPINLPDTKQDELKIDTKDLQPGVYYVHIWVKDNVHSDALKKEIRVLVENR